MAKNILVVDDSASVRTLLNVTLSNADYNVVEAVDGKDALPKIANQRFDLVISDVNMPNLDGIGLVKEIKTNALNKFTPIIMLTTESGSTKMQQGKEAGAKAWIVKPFDRETLLGAVNKLC